MGRFVRARAVLTTVSNIAQVVLLLLPPKTDYVTTPNQLGSGMVSHLSPDLEVTYDTSFTQSMSGSYTFLHAEFTRFLCEMTIYIEDA